MINEYIKKIVFILLLALSIYIAILVLPYILVGLRFIIKVLIPFIIGFALAFILQPVVMFFQNKGLKRWLAVLVVLALFVIIVYFLIMLTVPHMIKDMKVLIAKTPQITKELKEVFNDFARNFDFLPTDYQPNFDNISLFVNRYIIKLGSFPTEVFDKLISYLSVIILVPMILIYFLLDYEKILCAFRNFLIKHNKIRFKNYLADLNKIMGSYFRGVFIVMIIITIIFSIAFSIIGLEFALFFAIIIGITNLIPYLGSYIGGALPFLFALLDSPNKAILVLIISVVVQTFESDILTPYIQSKNIKIHPLLVILALLIFGSLFGVIGMMVAVPILSIIKITLKHYPIIKSPST